jgi:hypothetical protein
MAGYWQGKLIAETLLGFIKDGDKPKASTDLAAYLKQKDDPRLSEIMHLLEEIFLAY